MAIGLTARAWGSLKGLYIDRVAAAKEDNTQKVVAAVDMDMDIYLNTVVGTSMADTVMSTITRTGPGTVTATSTLIAAADTDTDTVTSILTREAVTVTVTGPSPNMSTDMAFVGMNTTSRSKLTKKVSRR